jgi:hypothetical protein
MDELYRILGLILAAALSALGARVYQLVTEKLHIARSDKVERDIKNAIETGILHAAERMRGTAEAGGYKQAIAIATAKSIAPAFDALSAGQQEVLVKATYAKLRPSLQEPTPISTLPPGTSLVLSLAPTLPPIKQPAEEGTTSSSGTYQPVKWPDMPEDAPKPTPAELEDPRIPRPSAVPREGTTLADLGVLDPRDTPTETPRSKAGGR